MTKRIVVVGGGYLGIEVAKRLERVAHVTLVERASHFVHAPAMIRATVEPSLLDRALIPYDRLLAQGAVVRGEAVSLDESGVDLADGTCLEADFIVLATGSSNAAPFKSKSGDIEGLRAANDQANAAIRSARSIAVVGAGAVGTELAGEIAHAMPEKSVTLISKESSLFPSMPPALGRSLFRKLSAMRVRMIFDTSADSLASLADPHQGHLVLSSGAEIEADLIIPAVGSSAHSTLADTLPGVKHSSSGRIKVDRLMRPSDLPNVFAAGDVADAGDAMTIVAVTRQGPWLAKTLRALAEGADANRLKSYSPWSKAPILLPLGPQKGASFLMLFTAGDRITRMMKGKDLFLRKYRKALGHTD